MTASKSSSSIARNAASGEPTGVARKPRFSSPSATVSAIPRSSSTTSTRPFTRSLPREVDRDRRADPFDLERDLLLELDLDASAVAARDRLDVADRAVEITHIKQTHI